MAHFKDLEGMLEQRHAAINQGWAKVALGWADLKVKMSEVGMSMRSANLSHPVRLNVGGSEVCVPRFVLEDMEESPAGWTLGDLFGGGVWDEVLPRDSDGHVFLDESPACFQHLVQNLAKRFGKAGGGFPDLAAVKHLPADELPYLPFVAGALLGSPPPRLPSNGGVAEENAVKAGGITAKILSWCPGEPGRLELLYRASRDGWTDQAFLSKIGCSSATITLVRVKAGGSGSGDSVVGGFSSVPWNNIPPTKCVDSPGAFVFMLKDGGEDGPEEFQPVKWDVTPGAASKVCCCQHMGFGFSSDGNEDLIVRDGSHTLKTGNNTFHIPAGSPFLALNGDPVLELEVFLVCRPSVATPSPVTPPPLAPTPPSENIGKEGLVDCPAIVASDFIFTDDDDERRFGESVAESLERERDRLRHAQTELVQANARAKASVRALAAVYGPDTALLAQGDIKEDPVIELIVRGAGTSTRMATLLSTVIQTCPPESFLAVRFERWSRTNDDKDEHGRRQIDDCSPHVFNKLLDVLRMKKRVSWDGGGGSRLVRVAVKACDRASFEELVSVYFYGCESFVMNSVQFL